MVASTAAQSAVVHDSLAAAVPGHTSLVEAILRRVGRRICCHASSRTDHCLRGRRIANRGMRRAGVCYHSLRVLHRAHHHRRRRSVHLDEHRTAGWGLVEEACCTRGALSLCAEALSRWTIDFQPLLVQPASRQDMFSTATATDSRYLLRLCMHRQPVWVEAFVVRHGGVQCVCAGANSWSKADGYICMSSPGGAIQCASVAESKW